jgi:hypothetical protein
MVYTFDSKSNAERREGENAWDAFARPFVEIWERSEPNYPKGVQLL